MFRSRFSARNLFWLAYVLLILCTFDTNIAADYPDTTVTFLVGALFWMAWTWWEWGMGAASGWVLIVVGAGAMSTKVSGSLLLAAAFFAALYLTRISPRVLLRYSLLAVVLILPTLTVQGITSGYPLFPAFPVALPVSWAPPPAFVLAARNSIRRYPLYGYDRPSPMTLAEKTEKILFRQLTPTTPYVSGVLLVFLASAAIAWRRRKPLFPFACAASLGAIGLFMLLQVPQVRFTIGYFTVLPALVLAFHPRRLALGVLAATVVMMYIAGPTTNRLDIARATPISRSSPACRCLSSPARRPLRES